MMHGIRHQIASSSANQQYALNIHYSLNLVSLFTYHTYIFASMHQTIYMSPTHRPAISVFLPPLFSVPTAKPNPVLPACPVQRGPALLQAHP